MFQGPEELECLGCSGVGGEGDRRGARTWSVQGRDPGGKALEGVGGDGIWLLLKRPSWLLGGLIAEREEKTRWRKMWACLCPRSESLYLPLFMAPSPAFATSVVSPTRVLL